MKRIEKFILPEHHNELYTKEAISSISLAREVADKINELVDRFNEFDQIDLTWKQEQEGRIRKGVLYMKDNLLNSLHELLELSGGELVTRKVLENIDDVLSQTIVTSEDVNTLNTRLENLLTKVKAGSTTMDTEIIDARTDLNGNTKQSLGEHIRNGFKVNYARLNNEYLDGINFYHSFENLSYLLDPAYNRLGNREYFTLNRDMIATAPTGYKVSCTVWVDDKVVGDSGWCDRVTIPKNFNTRFGVKKIDDGAIDVIDIYKISFEEDKVGINGLNISELLEYTSAGYFSSIRLCVPSYAPLKPITISCGDDYSIAVKIYKIVDGVRQYQKDTGWCKGITLHSGLDYEINFKKDDGSVLFKEDLRNITFSVYDTNVTPNENIKSICHRGYNVQAPENTLSAYKLAKKNGFKYVECDVSFTKDNVGVLLHDNTIDRTSNGTGEISTLTYDEVSALDFGSWFSEEYAGEKIPTFEEFIKLCKRLGLHPYIEIKYGANESQVKSIVDIVKRNGMTGKVSYISFEHSILNYVFNADNKARMGFVCNVFTETELNNVKNLMVNNNLFIDLNVGNVTDDSVQLAMDNNLPMEVWTVNKNSTILDTDYYVSGFTTDYVLTECLFNEV